MPAVRYSADHDSDHPRDHGCTLLAQARSKLRCAGQFNCSSAHPPLPITQTCTESVIGTPLRDLLGERPVHGDARCANHDLRMA
jgi:hypothetical protein